VHKSLGSILCSQEFTAGINQHAPAVRVKYKTENT